MDLINSSPDEREVSLTFSYDVEDWHNDFSHLEEVRLQAGEHRITRVFYPVYVFERLEPLMMARVRFNGIIVPEHQRQSIIGIYRVKRPEDLPFLVPLVLSPDWKENERLYLRFKLNGPEVPLLPIRPTPSSSK